MRSRQQKQKHPQQTSQRFLTSERELPRVLYFYTSVAQECRMVSNLFIKRENAYMLNVFYGDKLKQQERSLLQGPALIVAVKQKMKMKEIYLSKPPMGYRCEGPAARPINRPWKKQKGLGENALSQVDANSKDHEQDRQTDAAYPVSSFRESVQRTLCMLFCLFQLGCPRISGESGTNQKHQTDPDHHKHFSNQNLTIPRPERAGSRQGQRHPC